MICYNDCEAETAKRQHREGGARMKIRSPMQTGRRLNTRRWKRWRRVFLLLMSGAVVFCTSYALILPAITMADGAGAEQPAHACGPSDLSRIPGHFCGMGEHTHGDACFNGAGECTCTIPAHTHTESCAARPNPADSLPPENVRLSDGPVFQAAARRIAPIRSAASGQTVRADAANIRTYVESNGGTFGMTLLNSDNTEPEKDADGNYLVVPGQLYKLTLGIGAPDGIPPGTYTYDLPAGLIVQAGTGVFMVNGVEFGTWHVDAAGHIEMTFHPVSDHYTDVTVSAMMGVTFLESEATIDFDGLIQVVIRRPPEETGFTIQKEGVYEYFFDEEQNEYIIWVIRIDARPATSLVGQVIADEIVANTRDNHKYTARDRAYGLHIEAAAPDGTRWQWTAMDSGDGLQWRADGFGWTYEIPASVQTADGQTVQPGAGWHYEIRCTTTVIDTVQNAIALYRNEVSTGGESDIGYMSQQRGDIIGGVEKTGALDKDTIHWKVTMLLAGTPADGRYTRWYGWDYMKGYDAHKNHLPEQMPYVNNKGDFFFNVPQNIRVTVQRGNEIIPIPPISDTLSAGENQYAYRIYNKYSAAGWALDLYMPCRCTPETCYDWSSRTNKCRSEENGWCQCWWETESVVLEIEYDTEAAEMLEHFGGVGNRVMNGAELYRNGSYLASDEKRITIPGVFKKTLRDDPNGLNGYVAAYTITVNEGHLDLSGQDTLVIADTMSETLAYIPGTMVITAEDTDGSLRQMTHGTDYTLEYLPADHRINITVRNPGSEKYILQYDAQIVIPPGAVNVGYANYAEITLFGKQMQTETEEKILAEITVAAKNYRVTVQKTDAETHAALPGAVFGLFTENGESIVSGQTDETGTLIFRTNVTAGVILKEHTPYFLQELEAPAGYLADSSPHWLVFCDGADSCETCRAIMAGFPGMIRVPAAEGAVLALENARSGYVLPETGGSGIRLSRLYRTGGLLLTAGSLLAGLHRRRKRERRE